MKREDLRFGGMAQFGGALLLQLLDGPELGVRGALLRSGSGLNLLVLADRGMDIGFAEYKGRSLSWNSPTGFTSPAFFEPQGFGWLRGFYGGLLVTGGLTYMGAPCVDEGQELGLHGRASYTPARSFTAAGEWEGDEYVIRAKGEVREASVFGPSLVLRREIEMKQGANSFIIRDLVRNEGFNDSPFMMLYHFNLGYPLLSPSAKLITTSRLYVPRDDEAWQGHESFDSFDPPTKGYKEKVYFHDLAVDGNGFALAGLVNGDLGLRLKFKRDVLKRFIEWKMMGEGTYVVGLEPSNALVMGRAEERKRGTLELLSPGEERSIEIEVEVLDGPDQVEGFVREVNSVTRGQKPALAGDVEDFLKRSNEQGSRR
ncbi:MAG: aldose 1-epimerase family protein [Thermoprotei archaeon]